MPDGVPIEMLVFKFHDETEQTRAKARESTTISVSPPLGLAPRSIVHHQS